MYIYIHHVIVYIYIYIFSNIYFLKSFTIIFCVFCYKTKFHTVQRFHGFHDRTLISQQIVIHFENFAVNKRVYSSYSIFILLNDCE